MNAMPPQHHKLALPAGGKQVSFVIDAAANLVPSGRKITLTEGQALVFMLRQALSEAPDQVASLTGLSAEAQIAASTPIKIVSRASWIKWAGAWWQKSIAPAENSMLASVDSAAADHNLETWGSWLKTEAKTIARYVKAPYLLTKAAREVIGAVDPIGKQLLIIAPNIWQMQKSWDVDAIDLRIWVALREFTRATVYTCASSWLPQYAKEHVTEILENTTGSQTQVNELLWLRGAIDKYLDIVVAQLDVKQLNSALVLQTLLPQFTASRANMWQGLALDVAGIKTQSYLAGGNFLAAAAEVVTLPELSRMWADQQYLPQADELTDPAAWSARLLSATK